MKRDPSLIRLSRDHNRGLMMALRIQQLPDGASEEELDRAFAAWLGFWDAALLPHFRAECECLLTRLARHTGQDDPLLARTQQDHLRVNWLVTEMRDGNLSRSEGLRQVAALLREHIRWEEAVLFEAAQEMLSDEEAAALRRDIEARIPEVPAAAPDSAES
jgi:hypothetical protein